MRALLSNVFELVSLPRQVWSNPRARFSLDGKILFFRATFDEPFSSIVVSKDLSTEDKEEAKNTEDKEEAKNTEDKEEAKNILTSFLKKQGLSSKASVEAVKRSSLFLDHLVSKLHSVRMSHRPAGRELTTVEIGKVLLPYLESLSEKRGIPKLVDKFSNPTVTEVNSVSPISPSNVTPVRRKLRALSKLDKRDLDGNLAPPVLYLLEFGMDLEQIKKMAWRFPLFTYCSLEGNIKPLVEFLLDLGVSKSDIPIILTRCPCMFGCSIKENLLPTVALLESVGVEKRLWARILCHAPSILTFSRQKIEATVTFLLEMGVAAENIGKVLKRCPNLIATSIEGKLRPIAKYLRSFGVDVAIVLHQHPTVFKLSIESNLKHVTQYFLGKGFSKEELGKMITRFGSICAYSLINNLVPKWEFFLTMGYPKEDLVNFPHYFGYSLEERIKPRYALVKESGVKMRLGEILILPHLAFHKALNKKLDKVLSSKA